MVLKEFMLHFISYLKGMFNEMVILSSIALSTILGYLGYPKTVLTMIFFMVIFDMFTKWYAIVRSKFGRFGIMNFLKAWYYKYLNSRDLKAGIGVKVLIYVPLLIVANKIVGATDIYFADEISKVIYSMVFLVEFRSLLENAEEAGFDRLSPLVRFIKNKEELIVGEEETKEGDV